MCIDCIDIPIIYVDDLPLFGMKSLAIHGVIQTPNHKLNHYRCLVGPNCNMHLRNPLMQQPTWQKACCHLLGCSSNRATQTFAFTCLLLPSSISYSQWHFDKCAVPDGATLSGRLSGSTQPISRFLGAWGKGSFLRPRSWMKLATFGVPKYQASKWKSLLSEKISTIDGHVQ